MRIAFDIAPLRRPYPPGVVRACHGLLEALKEHSSLEVLELAPAAGEGERGWRQRRLPRLAAEAGCVGVHSPISAFAWRGAGRRVQTVHELPWHHGAGENSDLLHRFWARFGPWRADAVLCPTETVRRDLLCESPGAATKIHVTPWGLGPVFAEATPRPVDPGALRRRNGLPEAPLVLAVGAVRRKKNLAATLRALAIEGPEAGPALHVLVTGPTTPELEQDLELALRLELRERVHLIGQVSDESLADLLGLADAVVVLSTSEGFGFPVLEALACGAPVVVSRGSAQAEVAGPCGIAVDPGDPRAVAAALRGAVASSLRERQLRRARALQFSWERCARQVEEVWRRWA
jgi:alpha-1,3-rhamnosyl/mannosyltransferase